jgi:hypothetical protein
MGKIADNLFELEKHHAMPRGCVVRKLVPSTAEVSEPTHSSATARAEEEERSRVPEATAVKYYRRSHSRSA